MTTSALSALAVRLHPDDSVVVALRDILAGESVANEGVTVREPIPRSHKIAVRPIDPGKPVRKFGQIIGVASRPIAPTASSTPSGDSRSRSGISTATASPR